MQPMAARAALLACRQMGIGLGLQSQQAASWARQSGKHCSLSGVTAASPMHLAEVVKLDELLRKSPEEVADIWLGYHADPKGGRTATVMSAPEYHKLKERAKESPMFVLPLAKASAPQPGPGGSSPFLTLLVQCQLPVVLITGLEEFKRHGPSAPPYLTLTHYPELLDSHGLCLVRGDVIHDKGLSLQEARALMELTRAFYCDDDDYAMVRQFNHQPAAFDFQALLKKLGLGAAG